MGIKLLDCTLRDGGHLNHSKFGEAIIRNLIIGLEKTRVDIVEIGFVRENEVGRDYAAADDITEWDERFNLSDENVEYCVMIQEDQYDIRKLPVCNGKIKRVRVSFHDYDREEGLAFCEQVIQKGYFCHVNPINITGYTDEEILYLIRRVNEMNAAAFTLVDTFGSMTKDDLLRFFTLANHNLRSNVAIGLHFHDNLKMAFSLAQTAAEIASDKREVIIDGSLLGMGRKPGNLSLELIMEHLNRSAAGVYDVDTALDLIDDIIVKLREKHPWGYETAYSLSAQYKLHRTYAEYLMKKQKLRTKEIRQILGMISVAKSSRFDEGYVEGLYQQFISVNTDDKEIRSLLYRIVKSREILLLAPGSSINHAKDRLIKWITEKKPFIISANFKCSYITEDRIFCSNLKRLEYLKLQQPDVERLILASHVALAAAGEYAVVNTNELAWFGNFFWDNCMLMLLNLLKSIGIKSCYVAGWDGFTEEDNFVDSNMESSYRYVEENEKVISILNTVLSDLKINFLTPSIYQKGGSKNSEKQ